MNPAASMPSRVHWRRNHVAVPDLYVVEGLF